MILVQSRQQRLSGNNWLTAFCLASAVFLTACGSFKKVSSDDSVVVEPIEIEGGKVYNPETGKYETPNQGGSKVDTVQWTDTSIDENPPIVTDTDVTNKPGEVNVGERLSSYDIAVCLPFLGNKFNEYNNGIDKKSMLAVDFYSGMKVAFDELSSKGVVLNVNVLDTEASNTKMKTILDGYEVSDAEMIIGPVKNSNLALMAEYAKKHKKVLVSPINPSNSLISENPYFVQASPSLKSHCEAITKHVLASHSPENVVLVVRNKNAEKKRLDYFQDALLLNGGTGSFQEFIVNDGSTDFNEMDPMPYIKSGKETVFIVPSWSNENFVYALMRKLSIAKGRNKVVVYGMPQWKDYKRIAYDYYERLNLHISNTSAIDYNSPAVKNFRERYYEYYKMTPSENAFLGYDWMMYFGEMLNKYGTDFQTKIDANPKQLLHTNIDFQPVNKTGNIENLDAVDLYENKFVNILKFQDYRFQLAE